jgi:hypothetical protein
MEWEAPLPADMLGLLAALEEDLDEVGAAGGPG